MRVTNVLLSLGLTFPFFLSGSALAQDCSDGIRSGTTVQFLSSAPSERPEVSHSIRSAGLSDDLRAIVKGTETGATSSEEACADAGTFLLPEVIKTVTRDGVVAKVVNDEPWILADYSGDVLVTVADEESGMLLTCHFQDRLPLEPGSSIFDVPGADGRSYIGGGGFGDIPWIGDATSFQIALCAGCGGRDECDSKFDCQCDSCPATIRPPGRSTQCYATNGNTSPTLFCVGPSNRGRCRGDCNYYCAGSDADEVDVTTSASGCYGF